MPPFADYLKMGVTKPSSNMVPKKGRSDLTEVSQATPNPVKTIAQGTASTAPLGMNSKIQNLANIPKMSVTKSPFNFTNLIGQQQGGLPNTDFLKMGMQGPTQQSMQEFGTKLDDANASIKDNKRQFVERVAKGGVITKKEIEEQMSGFDDNKKREFLSVLGQSNAKIEGIDFNNEPKEGFTIGNTNISVNPIKQAGEKILEAKEYLKNNPQADPVMKTLLQGVINTLDQTGLLSIGGSANPVVNALEGYLPKTDNPVTQGLMGFAGNTTRGVGQVIEGGAGLVDKGIAGIQSLVQGGDMSQYQTRQTGIGEDILDVGAGATQSLASLYAMPASLLIGAGIEALPPEGQKAVSDTMTGLGGLIAKTPGLSQWMESLPPERRDEFKAELAGAAIGMLGGLKGKSNIIKNPKLFLQQNLNPVQLAKNFNENVIGMPSKALDMAVSTVGKIDLPEVNVPTVKVPKAVSNKVDMVIEQLEGVGKSKKEGIQNNPYSKEIYSKVIEDIDNGNAPQNYKDMQEPYTKKVVEELDTILDDVKSQKGEGGEAFNLLRQDQTPIDTTVEIKSMNDLLKGTDYSLKTFLNRVDKGNLLGTRKILDNTATISTLHDIRKGLDDLMLKAQANKDSGEFKILKNMRKIVDGKLKENPDRVKADEEWARISKDIQEIEEGITYREQRKKGQIRDNIDSIIENINNPAKAKLRERLLQYMPDIGERISAIRGIPEIAKAYTTIPQGVIGRTAGALGGVAIGSTGGIPGMILGGIAGMFADVGLSQLRRNAIKKAIAKQSPKALKKLGEIQKAISDGKKLRVEQVIELQNFTNNLKKSLPANDKELISKVSELPQVMKTSLVPVKEGPLESRGYTQKLTSPKREITEINPMAGKKYTAQDLLQEVRAKKTGDKGNNPKIPANTPKELPANKKLSDNLLTKLNNPKKPVQSDTLVSKADSMEKFPKNIQELISDRRSKYKVEKDILDKAKNLIGTAPKENVNIRNTDIVLKNKSDSKLQKILDKGELKKVKVSEIQGTQYGDDILNASSINTAKSLRSVDLVKLSQGDFMGARLEDMYPIVIKNGEIVDGHHRLMAAALNGDDYIYAVNTKPKSTSIPKDLQPLYEEARKYKSAEEFVKAKDIDMSAAKDWKPKDGQYHIETIDLSKTNALQKEGYYPENYKESESVKYRTPKAKAGEHIPPIVVQKTDAGYHVLDGYHRLSAMNDAGIKNAKAIIIENPVKIPTKEKVFESFTDKELKELGKSQLKQIREEAQSETSPFKKSSVPSNESTQKLAKSEKTSIVDTMNNKLIQEAKGKTYDDFLKSMIRSKNKYMTNVDTFKPLSELDSQELNRAIGTIDWENIPKEVTLYRGIKKDIDFSLNPGDFLTKNKKIAEDFSKGGRVKSFKIKTEDLLGDTYGNEEVLYTPHNQLRKIREEANKKPVQSDTLVSKADSMSKDLQPLYDEAKKYKSADEFAKKVFDKELKEGDIVYYKDSMNNIAKAKYHGKNGFGDLKLEYIGDGPLGTDGKNIDPSKLYGKVNSTALQKKLDGIREGNIKKRIDFENTKGDYDTYKKTTDIEAQLRKIREEANKK